jgi:hypothetical protein
MVIGVVLYVLTRRTAAATPNGGGESRMTATPNGGGDPGWRRTEAGRIPRTTTASEASTGRGGRRVVEIPAVGGGPGRRWRGRRGGLASRRTGRRGDPERRWRSGTEAAAIPVGGERRRRRSRSGEVGTERWPQDGGGGCGEDAARWGAEAWCRMVGSERR